MNKEEHFANCLFSIGEQKAEIPISSCDVEAVHHRIHHIPI